MTSVDAIFAGAELYLIHPHSEYSIESIVYIYKYIYIYISDSLCDNLCTNCTVTNSE